MTLTLARLETLLQGFESQTIALLGDLFLDRYLELEPGVHELSIETGLEAYQITRVRNAPGALGTVMNNLAALGVGRLVPITVIGDDGQGYDLLQALAKLPVDPQFVVQDPQRLTPTYTKPLRRDSTGVWQELNRLDLRAREPLRDETERLLRQRLRTAWDTCDGLVVLDQIVEENWGVVNASIRDELMMLHRREPGKLLYIDSRAFLHQFTSGILKGNRSEFERDATDALEQTLERLAARQKAPIFCTQGERGIQVACPGEAPQLVPGYPVAGPVDIVGAGDAASSGIVASLLAGASPLEAAAVGNLAASITVQQLGTTGTASPEQLRQRLREVSNEPMRTAAES